MRRSLQPPCTASDGHDCRLYERHASRIMRRALSAARQFPAVVHRSCARLTRLPQCVTRPIVPDADRVTNLRSPPNVK